MRKGGIIVHAGGERVFIDQFKVDDTAAPAKPVEQLLLADDGRRATIRCVGPKSAGIGEQWVDLDRPSKVTITRAAEKPITWWYAGDAKQHDNTFTWSNGTRLTVTHGTIHTVDPKGYVETKVHFGGMKWADPHPFTYPTATVEPQDGEIAIEVISPVTKSARQ
jgi:hypothetical protein